MNLLEEDEGFRDKKERLEKVPVVKTKTIAALLCYVPELGNINRKQLSALMGLAPFVCDSGKTRGKAPLYASLILCSL